MAEAAGGTSAEAATSMAPAGQPVALEPAEPGAAKKNASAKKSTGPSLAKKAKVNATADAEASAVPLKPATASREDNLMYDLRHLAAFDMSPLHPSTDLGAYSRDSVQLLVNKIFMTLERTESDTGPVATLPTEEVFKLPRSKPIPKVKAKTRWQKFMEERNMKKRKRSRLVFDEASGDWKPRWGYKSAKNSQAKADNWAMEVKPGQDPTENPFTRQAAEKKLLLARQKMREVRNKVEALGGKLKAGTPTLGKQDGLQKGNSGRGRDGLREAIKRAQGASASMGKFDRRAPNEPTNLQQKKRKASFAATASGEKERYMKAANRIFSGDGSVDKDKAAKAGARANEGKKTKVQQQAKSKRRSKQGGRKPGGRR